MLKGQAAHLTLQALKQARRTANPLCMGLACSHTGGIEAHSPLKAVALLPPLSAQEAPVPLGREPAWAQHNPRKLSWWGALGSTSPAACHAVHQERMPLPWLACVSRCGASSVSSESTSALCG